MHLIPLKSVLQLSSISQDLDDRGLKQEKALMRSASSQNDRATTLGDLSIPGLHIPRRGITRPHWVTQPTPNCH